MPDVHSMLSHSAYAGPGRPRSVLHAAVAAVLGLPVALTLPGVADAQTQDSGGLEEVLVTATRRGDVSLQDVPVSVTALNAEELSRLVSKDISGISATVPNFSATRITAFNAASFAIRGVGQTDIIVYLDAPVAVNIDDFVMPSVQTQLLDTFDIERVEVLRGPQGTLFGKNTTGGLVNVTTKRPVIGEGGVEARALYGDFGHYQLQGALNLPLGDTFAMRFMGSYDKSDGYYENGATYGPTVSFDELGGKWDGLEGSGNGDDVGGSDIMNGRIKALWQPNEDFSALFQYEIVRDESDAVPAFNDTPREPDCLSVFQVLPGTPGTCVFLWNSLGLRAPDGDPIDKVATTSRNDAFMATGRGQRIDVDGFYLNLDWDLGGVALAGNVGYREQESRLPNTYTGAVPIADDGEQMSLFDASRDDDRETFQAEVRLSSNAEGAFDWVIGGFYQTNDDVFCVAQALGFVDMTGATPSFFQLNQNPQILCNKQDAEAIAAFGDVNWSITDQLTIGAGVRWTEEKKDWTGRPQAAVQAITFNPTTMESLTWQDFNEPLDLADFGRSDWAGNAGVVSNDETWSEPTYSARIAYAFSEDVNTYFRYDRGFKSGGYNDQTGTAGVILPAFAAPYDPEFADSFELGLKTSLADDRLRFNAALFYTEYSDAQRALVTRVCIPQAGAATICSNGQVGQEFQETRFFNAADVTVQGVELEATWLALESLRFGANFSYNDGEYDKFEADTDGDGVNDVNLSGLPLTRTPEIKWGLNGLWSIPMLGGHIDLYAQVSYEDDNVFYYSDIDPIYNSILDERTLVDASVTWFSSDDHFFIRAFGNNLTDERYRVASQVVANLWTHSQFGTPREYGVQVGVNFGY